MHELTCPKCAFPREPMAADCGRCGIVFARWRAPSQQPLRQRPPAEEVVPARADPAPVRREIDGKARRALGLGLVLGLLALWVPLFGWILSYLVILVHEMGHAGCWWLLGFPAVPAFDFMYGGGVTMHQNRSLLLTAAVYGLLSWLLIKGFRRPRVVALWAGLTLCYSLLAFSPLGDLLALAMGHGAEVLWIVLCFYRLLSGRLVHEVERPLYGMLGFFTFFHAMGFAWNLVFSEGHRLAYGAAKGGGNWMDFDRIAAEYLGTDLTVVAFLFMMTVLASLPAAWWLHVYHDLWQDRLQRLKSWFEAEPG